MKKNPRKIIQVITVDLQNEFASKGGKCWRQRPSVDFLKQIFFPFLEERKMQIHEIISDYRQPRQGDRGDCCYPGTWGYQSIIPDKLRKSLWIKSMNSPVWVRKGLGKPGFSGLPYPDHQAFETWLKKNIGKPERVVPLLIGLTIDCCVLSTLQELSWLGYAPVVLRQGVDHRTGRIEDRDQILESPVSNWARVVEWGKLREELS